MAIFHISLLLTIIFDVLSVCDSTAILKRIILSWALIWKYMQNCEGI